MNRDLYFYFVALLFRGSLIHVRIDVPPPRCCSPETMLRKCQSRWLVIVFWLYLRTRRRRCYVRVSARIRACACSYFNTYTRKLNMSEYLAVLLPRDSAEDLRGEGGMVYLSARYPAHLVYAHCLTQQAHKSPSYTRKTISREGSCLLPILFLSNLSFRRWLPALDSAVVV